MTSLPQRLLTLNAWLFQKPMLALVRNPVLMRRMFTVNAIVGYKTPSGLKMTPIDLTDRPAVVCSMGHDTPNGTTLYLHGGAFMIGDLRSYRHLVARLGQAAGTRAIFLDYRRAPEHPFPAALDDAESAWRALARDPDAGPLTLAGDSSGGNLALALLHRIIAKDLARPCAVAVMSPVTDLRLQNDSLRSNRRSDPLVSARWGERGVAAYLNGADPMQPDASPILGNFAGAPPVMIHTDRQEILYDDATFMADRLRSQGVSVELVEADGLPHVWHLYVGRTIEAGRSVAQIGTFLSDAVKGTL